MRVPARVPMEDAGSHHARLAPYTCELEGASGAVPALLVTLLMDHGFAIVSWHAWPGKAVEALQAGIAQHLSLRNPPDVKGRRCFSTDDRKWYHLDGTNLDADDALRPLFALMFSICVRCVAAVLLPEERAPHSRGACVLDAFFYPRRFARERGHAMGPHVDPGLVTLKPLSQVQALEILPRGRTHWLRVEQRLNASFVLFVGDALADASNGRLAPALHRVSHAREPRISLVFELRPPRPPAQEYD
ncbi:hypothetical protein M885DRAFT_542285 [Pelagophyceae sp. CCMP2097]|nr:hypothetical protein M885DRAFT_544124 [Pelagophyceae sp. CCMP2097]KAJ1447593.1 hypothetical protein M885DRAFT_542285 [Pelagophyceae sp. CCMP2097]